jgi:hypothetical protein
MLIYVCALCLSLFLPLHVFKSPTFSAIVSFFKFQDALRTDDARQLCELELGHGLPDPPSLHLLNEDLAQIPSAFCCSSLESVIC